MSTSSITAKARAAGIIRLAKFSATAGIATALGATATLPILVAATSGGTSHDERTRATNDVAYLGALAIQRVLDAAVAAFTMPTSAGEAAATLRALEQAASVQERINKVRRTVLRLDRENSNSDAVLPELPIRTMADAEIAALQAEQAAFDGLSVADQRDRLDQLDRDAQDGADDVSAEPAEDHVEGFQDAA